MKKDDSLSRGHLPQNWADERDYQGSLEDVEEACGKVGLFKLHTLKNSALPGSIQSHKYTLEDCYSQVLAQLDLAFKSLGANVQEKELHLVCTQPDCPYLYSLGTRLG
eukprot:gene11630-3450_t